MDSVCFKRKRVRTIDNIESSTRSSLGHGHQTTGNKPVLRQSFLDLGQRNFHVVQCPGCGMTYAPGQPDDESLHRGFHNKLNRPRAPKYIPAQSHIKLWSQDHEKVVEIETSSSLAQAVTNFLSIEQGVVPEWLEKSSPRLLMHVHTVRNAIQGVLWLERAPVTGLESPMTTPNCAQMTLQSNAAEEQVNPVVKPNHHNSSSTAPACPGVRYIWTAPAFRRQGIAQRLLNLVDPARTSRWAFTCLTSEGSLLAASVTQPGSPVRTYDIGLLR